MPRMNEFKGGQNAGKFANDVWNGKVDKIYPGGKWTTTTTPKEPKEKK